MIQILIESIAVLLVSDGLLCAFSPRIRTLNKAFFNMFVGKAEEASVDALIEQAREDLNTSVHSFDDALSEHAGNSDSLMHTVEEQRTRFAQLKKSVDFYLGKGDRATAGPFAAELQKLEGELHSNEDLLSKAEATYKGLLAQRDAKIKEVNTRIDDLSRRTKQNDLRDKTNALQEQGNAMSAKFTAAGRSMDRLSKMVATREEKSVGRARVVHDTSNQNSGPLEIPPEVAQADALAAYEAANAPKQLNAPVDTTVTTFLKTGAPVEQSR